MQNEQEFYRCLVSDAAGRTLKKILEIIRDDTLSDEICFHKIEAIISLYEELGISTAAVMISDNRKALGNAARFRIVSCSRKGRFPPQGRGAHSFLEKNPPHTPEEKHQGVSTSPWTPNDTKAGGLGPRLWKPTPKGTKGERRG